MGEHSPATAVQTTDARGPADRMPKSPTMEFAEEITMVSSGPEPMGTTSVPIGYESPYIRALMADTSTEAIRSDGYVFDFDYLWDEEEEEVAAKADEEPENTTSSSSILSGLRRSRTEFVSSISLTCGSRNDLVILRSSEPAVERPRLQISFLVYPFEEARRVLDGGGDDGTELPLAPINRVEDAFSRRSLR